MGFNAFIWGKGADGQELLKRLILYDAFKEISKADLDKVADGKQHMKQMKEAYKGREEFPKDNVLKMTPEQRK